MKIPLSSVSVTNAEIEAVLGQLRMGAVSGSSAAVGDLEEAACDYTGRRFAVATNSGTSALELALQCLGVADGDEVALPGFTFAAPASAVLSVGGVPVVVDVEEDSWTLSPSMCAKVLSPRTKALIAVDVMGNPCDYAALRALGVPVVQDAAESLGSMFDGLPCGAHGDISILSLHANKVVSAGEGGILLTDDPGLAEKARIIANHGMTAGYLHEVAGHNYRLGALSAAFATAQLLRLEELVERRREIEEAYRQSLEGLPLMVQRITPGGARAPWLVCFRTSLRDDIVSHLRQHGVDARAVWPSLQEQPFLNPWSRVLRVSTVLSQECFWLPTFFDMTMQQVNTVAGHLRDGFDKFGGS